MADGEAVTRPVTRDEARLRVELLLGEPLPAADFARQYLGKPANLGAYKSSLTSALFDLRMMCPRARSSNVLYAFYSWLLALDTEACLFSDEAERLAREFRVSRL